MATTLARLVPGDTPPVGLESGFQWQWMSNELRTPKVLVCPSDQPKRPASDWGIAPEGGFLNPAYRNAAVSYLIGLDVFPEDRLGLVAGDRNAWFSRFDQSCSSDTWSTLFAHVVATSSSRSVVDNLLPRPAQRFYRVVFTP